MKSAFNLILITIIVSFYSCKNDENVSTVNSSITNNGTLSGIILNYKSGKIDSVKAVGSYLIGKSELSSVGKFSIDLSIPQVSRVGTADGYVVSDSSAMIGYLHVDTYHGGELNGGLYKCNFSRDSITKAGESNCYFLYSDRTFTLKGSHTYTQSNESLTYVTTLTYNVIIKKGFNELDARIDSYIVTPSGITSSKSMSNVISSEDQWRYYSIIQSFVRGKLNGVPPLKSDKFFWPE